MITCSRCGKVISVGQSNCQYCGMPVMNRNEHGTNTGKVGQDQPELPAWLQSLRAGTQPTYTTGGNANFSASDLVEEGALPGWMKPGQPGQPEAANGQTGPHPVLHPSSMPAPTTDGSVLPGGSMSASSLIDEQALPSWIREQAGDRQGLEAANLVQPEALPDWLRDAQVESQSPKPLAPPVSWQPQVQQPLQPPPPQPGFPSQGLAASDLVDAQSLPPWLSGQPGTSANGEGLSAASLLDMNALPPWLREHGQGPQGPRGLEAANPPTSNMNMNMNGLSAPSSVPMPPGRSQQPPAGNLIAASFIDMDALPDWLRSSGDGPQPEQSRPVTGGVPPRVENMRVPGRPRGAGGPQEASEAAANVFASMLGVASNAPQFPAPPQQGSQGQISFQSAQGSVAGPTQAQGYPGPGQGYGQPGPQGQPGFQNGYQSYPPGGQPGVSQPFPNQGMPVLPGQSAQSGQPGQIAQPVPAEQPKPKPARRGFLDTIREWFRF